jgi:hypothetical protein
MDLSGSTESWVMIDNPAEQQPVAGPQGQSTVSPLSRGPPCVSIFGFELNETNIFISQPRLLWFSCVSAIAMPMMRPRGDSHNVSQGLPTYEEASRSAPPATTVRPPLHESGAGLIGGRAALSAGVGGDFRRNPVTRTQSMELADVTGMSREIVRRALDDAGGDANIAVSNLLFNVLDPSEAPIITLVSEQRGTQVYFVSSPLVTHVCLLTQCSWRQK